MGLPQIIFVGLYALSLGCILAKHGEARTGKYNFFTSLFTVSLEMMLLWWGGFFG